MCCRNRRWAGSVGLGFALIGSSRTDGRQVGVRARSSGGAGLDDAPGNRDRTDGLLSGVWEDISEKVGAEKKRQLGTEP